MPMTEKAWTCDLKYKDCETEVARTWTCRVEQIPIAACRACWAKWQEEIRINQDLAIRCPRCAKTPVRHPMLQARATRTHAAEPLKGVIADALDAAMFREGILPDLRNKVLRRLAAEEPWLDYEGQSKNQVPA